MLDGDRMLVPYSIKVEYSPAYELVVSFYHYIYHRHFKAPLLGSHWREQTEQSLPQSFAQELQDERWEVLHRMVLLISQSPQKASVRDFLRWLEQLPAGEIYERLAPWVESIPLNLGEIRDRSLYLLSEWDQHYFQHIDRQILDRLRDAAEENKRRTQMLSPIDLIEEATAGIRIEPVEQLQTVILVPQYHSAPAPILDFFRGIATLLFPVQIGKTDDSFADIKQKAQCLADEKRLEILRLLSQGNHTLNELQKSVGLAKSTVHHHITSLRRAGMIRAHFVGHSSPAYYSLRPLFIGQLHDELQRHFSLEGEKNHE